MAAANVLGNREAVRQIVLTCAGIAAKTISTAPVLSNAEIAAWQAGELAARGHIQRRLELIAESQLDRFFPSAGGGE